MDPQPGERWEIELSDQKRYRRTVELRLWKKSEFTYTWCEPDDDVYHPVPIHIPIAECVLLRKITEDWQTRINGFPHAFYDARIERGPRRPPRSVMWSFDPQKYIQADLERQRKMQQSTPECNHENE